MSFLYCCHAERIQFRKPGDLQREIKQIAPEELASGMMEILKQNVTVDRNSLYRLLAAQCGLSRVGKATNEYMDAALCTLREVVVIDNDQISLK